MWCMHLTLSPGVNYGRTQEYWTWRSNMHKLFRNGFEGLNTSIDPHTFMYFKAPVHGSSIPGYISREGYIARLTYPKRLCSLYGGLWASRVTLWSLLVCIPNEEGWFPLLSLFPMEEFMLWNSSKLVTTHRHMEALLLCLNKYCICQTDACMQ